MSTDGEERDARWFAGAWPGRWRMLDITEEPSDHTPPDDVRLRRELDAKLASHRLPAEMDRASLEPHFLCEDCNAVILDDVTGEHAEPAWIGDWTGTDWR